MKQLKKGLVGLLVLALLVAYVPAKTLFATGSTSDGTVTIGEAKGKTGEEVNVKVSFLETTKVKALSISELSYDNTKLELLGGEWNVQNSIIADWNKYGNNEGVLAFADNTDVTNTFFTFKFKVIEESVDGDVAVTCKVGATKKLADGSEESLDLTVNAGKVTVETIKKQIVVGSGKGYTGKQISVPISLENNPGVVSMRLSLNYDKTVLKLNNVVDSGNLGENSHSDDLVSVPYTLFWTNSLATENFTYNGEIAVLVFDVLEDAKLGKTEISVSYEYEYDDILDCDMNPVAFATVNGIYEISDVLLGDVNEDGKITVKDGMMLQRYLSKWVGYNADTMNLAAADVNADGKVTVKDGMILQRHLSKWVGYSELPYLN